VRTGRLGLIFDPREDLAFEMAYRAVDRIERVRHDEKLLESIDPTTTSPAATAAERRAGRPAARSANAA
jgi:tRNA C32,U32 (ribose-2'-O)-methylase TrmJ